MKNLPVIFILVAIFSIAAAIQNYRDEYYPKVHNQKSTYQKPPKLTPQEEKEMLADIMMKMTSSNGDISEPLSQLEQLVRESPSTPKNVNFTSMVRQLEEAVRENVTKLIEEQMKSRDFPRLNEGVGVRHKRSNQTFQICLNILTSVGTVGGGSSGAALGASLFSIIPVIGTIIGGILGAQLGQAIGKSIAINIANRVCPK